MSDAPRVTPEDLEAEIVSEHYFTAHDATLGFDKDGNQVEKDIEQALSLLTFCVLVLRNGFTVTGQSACVSPENYDAALGRKLARQRAVTQIWPLLGFRLADNLAEQK